MAVEEKTTSEECERLKERYRKEKRTGLSMGILFLVLSVIFSIIGFATANYNVFYGVILQLFAGVTLVIQNRNCDV